MQHRGKVEGQPDDAERGSGQLADGAKRKRPAAAAVLLAGAI
jgi:hypothetical protein